MPKKKGKGRKADHHNHHHQKPKQSNALSDCKLPHDVVLNILTRLPVKTLLRFRCVCKPFKTLIFSPKFISLHLNHHRDSAASAATIPTSLLLHSIHIHTLDNNLSLFSLQQPLSSLSSSRRFIQSSIPKASLEVDVIGTHNGVLCLSQPPLGYRLSLLNPATKQYLPISTPEQFDPLLHDRNSIGFGFDPVDNCYKVIFISSAREFLNAQSLISVYNCDKGDYWETFEIKGPNIRFRTTKPQAIVNGVPYWDGYMYDVPRGRWVLFWFDMHKEVLHHIAMPSMPQGCPSYICGADWKGSFAFLMYPKDAGLIDYVSVVVIEDNGDGGKDWWNIKHRIGPLSGFIHVVGCSRNGYIVGVDGEGNLVLYDHESGGTHRFGIDGDVEGVVEVFNYTESLVPFKGGKPVSTLITQRDLFKIDKDGVGENIKIKFNSFGVQTYHFPSGNGHSVAVTVANGEYLFGHVTDDGRFEEVGDWGRLPVKGRRGRR